MSEIEVPQCKHYDKTVAELEADGYVMEEMPLCEMCSFDEITRLTAENERLRELLKCKHVWTNDFGQSEMHCITCGVLLNGESK